MTEINTEKLLPLITAFYNLTKIKVAVYSADFKEILTYPLNDGALCSMLHSKPISRNRCILSSENQCRECAKADKPIITTCHAGLTEMTIPLKNSHTVIGYIMLGQITNCENREDFLKEVTQKCISYGFSEEDIKRNAQQIKYFSENSLQNAAQVVTVLASYIVYEQLAFLTETPLIHNIIEYINNNLSKNLNTEILCRKFSISRSELYKISKPFMLRGVAAYIKEQRLNKACDLLTHTDKPLWEIAETVGFSDYDYFLRVFKHKKGIPAKKHRNNM